METMTLNWGILAPGKIAHEFARGIADSRSGQLVAVGSRQSEKARAFGAEYGVDAARCYGSYDDLLADPTVQAIYIALPNHLHAEWTVRCARAGKHVLCEKPLATNYAEAMVVIEEVRRCGVFLMEAFMYRCHPQIARLLQLIHDEQAIGQLRHIQATFSFNMGPQYTNIRLSNPAAGGGIMDVGCYTASIARLLAGSEPSKVAGVAQIGDISRVDELATASLLFPTGAVATLTCGTQAAADHELRLWGSSGSIRLPSPWCRCPGVGQIFVYRNGQSEPEVITVAAPSNIYAIEADLVADCIAAGRTQAPSPCMTWADSLGNMALLDSWRAAAGLEFDNEKPAVLVSAPATLRVDPPAGMTAMPYGQITGVTKPISRLVLGSIPLVNRGLPLACALLDTFVAAGGTTLDTAQSYGQGATDRILGQWMAMRGNREQIVIIGKGVHPRGYGPRVTPTAITSDLCDSLGWLQTDYIDLYFLHRDDTSQPVGPIMDTLNEHRAAGRIRAFGASNWTARRIAEANAYAEAHGLVGFVASSPNFTLAVPNDVPWPGCVSVSMGDGSELDWYRATRFPLFSWSSMAQGFFSGYYTPDDTSAKDMVRCWYSVGNWERLRRATELGRTRQATASQVALAYVLHQSFPTFALTGPATIEELRITLDGLRVSLTPAEMQWLNLEVQDRPDA